jgi:hypothetical protein
MVRFAWLGLVAGCGGGSADSGAVALGDVSISGHVFDAGSVVPLGGVEVCVVEYPEIPCATTGTFGSYDLSGLPDAERVHVSYTREDYWTLHWSFVTDFAETTWMLGLPATSDVEFWADELDTEVSETLGAITFKAVDDRVKGLEGTTATLRAPSFVGPGFGVDGQPSFQGEAMDASGIGVFVNVEPGTWDLVYSPPADETCTPRWGWSGNEPLSLSVTVVPGVVTFVEMQCVAR